MKAHETIGYNRKGELGYDGQIAIVPVGYADGLNRRLGNGVGRVMVNGQGAHIVGNICMDMCMVDVTGLLAEEGGEVEIFGLIIRWRIWPKHWAPSLMRCLPVLVAG